MIGPTFALFIRSLREDSRAKFTPIARATLVLAILFFIVVNERSFAYRTAPGQQVFMIVMMINLAGLVLGGLNAFCSAITEEKEDETLGLLRMTNLSPLAILFGKSVSRFVAGALLILAQLPFALLCVTLGGVSAAHIYKGYEVLFCTLFLLCNLGLLMSVISKRTAMSVALTVFIGTALYVGVPMGFVLLTQNMRNNGAAMEGPLYEALSYVMSNNPVYQIGTTVFGPARGPFPVVGSTIIFHACFGGVCFLLSWALFGRFCSGNSESAPARKKVGAGQRSLRIPRPGAWSLAWKEFWFHNGGRRGLILRFFSYSLLIFGFIAFVAAENSYMQVKVVGEMMIVFAGICMGVEIILASSRIFGLERRWLTLSSLLTLPVSMGKIIRQKIVGNLAVLIPGLCFVLLGAAIAPESVEDFFRELWRELFQRDGTAIIYAFMHLLVVPLLVCYLSLRMRRGGVPASIAIVFLWDFMFVALFEERVMRDEAMFFVTLIAIIVFGISWLFRARKKSISSVVGVLIFPLTVFLLLSGMIGDGLFGYTSRSGRLYFLCGWFYLAYISYFLARAIARQLPKAASAD